MKNHYNVNLDKIDRMAGLTFMNSFQLHFDSILLFNNESYSSSYFLSIIALEELGKFYQLDHFLFHSHTDERMGEEWDRKWLDDIFSHKSKQFWFADTNRFGLSKKMLAKLFNGKLDTEKQNSIYVGLPRVKKKIDLKGKVINPLSISRNKTKNQITILNDCLLEHCLIVINEEGGFDSYTAEKYITKKLIYKLESVWLYKTQRNMKYIS